MKDLKNFIEIHNAEITCLKFESIKSYYIEENNIILLDSEVNIIERNVI